MHPSHNRRDERARRARDTKNRDIPEMLRASPRARHGIHKADLIVDPAPFRETPQNLPSSTFPAPEMKIRIQCADTLSAAAKLSEKPFGSTSSSLNKRQSPNVAPSSTVINRSTSKSQLRKPNATVLNMASGVRPGGGFLDGANSQEEFLCARTTLYPSLWDSFYALPEISGIHTPDVLVFRDHLPEANDLLKRDRFFVDVISAGMFRFGEASRAEGGCSCGVSYCDRHRDLVARKMKAVLRIAQMKGVEKLVLGAWGCGGAGGGHPVNEMAKLWRKVIAGGPRQRRPNLERWDGIKEIVFAIPDRTVVRDFESAFEGVLAPPEEMQSPSLDHGLEHDYSRSSNAAKRNDSADPEGLMSPRGEHQREDDESAQISDLISRIAETEMQLETAANQPRARARLRNTLASLQRELAQGVSAKASRDEEDATPPGVPASPIAEEDEDGFVVAGFPASSDVEGDYYDEDAVASGGFYHFDEDDVASSDSSSSSLISDGGGYEFRSPHPSSVALAAAARRQTMASKGTNSSAAAAAAALLGQSSSSTLYPPQASHGRGSDRPHRTSFANGAREPPPTGSQQRRRRRRGTMLTDDSSDLNNYDDEDDDVELSLNVPRRPAGPVPPAETETNTFEPTRFDPSTGWFAGSMDQLSTLLRGGVVDGMTLHGDVIYGTDEDDDEDEYYRPDAAADGGFEFGGDVDGFGAGDVAAKKSAVVDGGGGVVHPSHPATPTVVRPTSKSGGFEIDESTLRSYLRRYEGSDVVDG